MTRLVFKKGDQKNFIEQVKKRSGLDWPALAKIAGVSGRTLRDWKREKFLASYEALLQLNKTLGIKLPKILEIRKEYWSIPKAARKGGLARAKIYGSPGTPEGRRKGGLTSQKLRRNNPEKYKFRKKITYPRPSHKLAEAFGIILGDGGITINQVFISLNAIADRVYADFVKNLFSGLFCIEVKEYKRKVSNNTLILGMSSVNLVEFLIKRGLFIGDKVRKQVGVPTWIIKNPGYRKGCLRGLMDTDGGVFKHKYTVNDRNYIYKKICFSNRSIPLLYFVRDELKNLGLNPKIQDKKQVWVYNKEGVRKYLKFVGSHNPRLLKNQISKT